MISLTKMNLPFAISILIPQHLVNQWKKSIITEQGLLEMATKMNSFFLFFLNIQSYLPFPEKIHISELFDFRVLTFAKMITIDNSVFNLVKPHFFFLFKPNHYKFLYHTIEMNTQN